MIPGTQRDKGMRFHFASMTAGLSVGITAAVVVACVSGAYIYSVHHSDALMDSARAGALADAELIRIALEHQMIENDRSLISRMVASFGERTGVERVVILDRRGVRRYTSRPQEPPTDLDMASSTCQACHRLPPEQRGSSRIIESRNGTLLRTVVPIRNRVECHRCHDPSHQINGILLLDRDAGEIHAAMRKDLRLLTLVTGALTLLLVGLIGLVFRIFVLRRLQRLETAARLVASGDLDRRVPIEGSDTLSWLAREFNTMADSLTGLVREVNNQRERLEMVINSVDDGIVVLDDQRRIMAANDAFLRRTGQSREQVLGCCCTDSAPERCTLEDCPSLACLKSGQRQVRICQRSGPDGATVWEEIHSSPVLDAGGSLRQVVEVWRDISERRAAEAHMAESHRLASLGLLASGFSHELNTPLATALMCLEGILREVSAGNGQAADTGRVRESASIGRDQILRCRGITQHFLRMSRGQRPPGDIVEIRSAVEAVRRLIEPTARGHSVSVAVHEPEGEVHVRADESDLHHALVNLLLNAIQACQPGGAVTVAISARESARIAISDNGCGIPVQYLKRIFEPFYGLRQGGTGLGLFLSLNFVRRWGGDIAVESEPGRGAKFEITLPLFVPALAQESGR